MTQDSTGRLSPYEMYQTDPKLESEGIWLDFGHFRIKVAAAGAGSQAFRQKARAIFKPYQRLIDSNSLSSDKERALTIELYAKAVVLDWENMLDRNREPLAFSIENVIQLLTDLPWLFEQLREEASKVANFRAEEIQNAIKNS